MAVAEVPVKYATRDGREFEDKGDAERHDALLEVREEYQQIVYRLGRYYAESLKTADGQPFEFGLWGDYFVIDENWPGLPMLRKVNFWGRNFTWQGDDLDLVVFEEGGNGTNRYLVTSLYRSERAAMEALLKVREEWLAAQVADIEKLRARLASTDPKVAPRS